MLTSTLIHLLSTYSNHATAAAALSAAGATLRQEWASGSQRWDVGGCLVSVVYASNGCWRVREGV